MRRKTGTGSPTPTLDKYLNGHTYVHTEDHYARNDLFRVGEVVIYNRNYYLIKEVRIRFLIVEDTDGKVLTIPKKGSKWVKQNTKKLVAIDEMGEYLPWEANLVKELI